MKTEHDIEDMVSTIYNLYLVAKLAKRWVELENEMCDADNHSCPVASICSICESQCTEYSHIMQTIKRKTADLA